MRPPRRLALAAAAMLLILPAAAFPLAAAQGESDLSLTLNPSSVRVARGANATADAVITNEGLAPLQVNLTATGPFPVALSRTDFTLAPGTSETVSAQLRTHQLDVGHYNVTFVARAVNPLAPEASPNATAVLAVSVEDSPARGSIPNEFGGGRNANQEPGDEGADLSRQPAWRPPVDDPPEENATAAGNESQPSGEENAEAPPLSPPPAPRLSPSSLDVTAPAGRAASFQALLENPHDAPQSFVLSLHLPAGWNGSLPQGRVEVPANGSVLVEGNVQASANATAGEGRLVARGEGGDASLLLRLRVEPPPPAAAPTNGTRATDAAPGSTISAASGQEPPRDPAPSTDAPAPVAPASPTPAAAPPPPPAAREDRVTLRVEPAEARIAPGQAAPLLLVVANGRDQDVVLDLRVRLPPGFLLEGELGALPLAAGETRTLPLVLRAAGHLAEGEEGTGVFVATGADEAPFRILVAPPTQAEAASPPPTAREPGHVGLAVLLAAGAGAVALGSAWAWRRRWHLALLALYARLAPHRVLDHPTRRAIADLLAAEPGLALSDVQRRLHLANGILRHHVDRLEATGHLRSVQDGQHRRLYPVSAGRVAPTPTLSERVLAAVRDHGAVRASDLASRLGVSRQSLHYHVKKLVREGRIDARHLGNELLLSPGAESGNAAAAPRRAPAGPTR